MSSVADFRAMADGELLDELEDHKEELFNLRFQMASGQLENTSRVKVVRREIACIKTVLRERQLAAQVLQEEADAE